MKLNKWYLIFFITIIISIFVYGKYRCVNPDYKDILAMELVKGIDGWIISHFVAFAIIGTLYPDTLILSIILGILWEIFEICLGKIKPSFLKGITDCHRTEKGNSNLSNDQKDGYWWYGKGEDVVADILGFLFGKYLLRKIIKI